MNRKKNNNDTSRLFAAIEIDKDTRAALQTAVTTLAKSGAHVKWVAPEKMHVSLFFLGNVKKEKIEEIEAVLDWAAEGKGPFDFQVEGIGTFGPQNSPRVIWAGVKNPGPIVDLQSDLSGALEEIGFSPDRREYKPHITIGRIKSGHQKRHLLRAIDELRDAVFGKVHSESLVLVESVLGPAGAQYRNIHRSKYA